MSYSEYRDLAPIDSIENGDEYIEALNWAFQNKKIKNIALTGPYGSGKSSIIETFLAEDDKKASEKGYFARKGAIRESALKISMATFIKGNSTENDDAGEKIDVKSDEVEKGILKQLFYKVEPYKIPQSRYRKLHAISFFTVFLHIVVGLFLFGLLLAIFSPSIYGKTVGAIKDFLPSSLSAPIFTVIATALLLALLSAVGAYLYLTVISKFKVKEIKLPTDTTVQSGDEDSDSVFNRNLDEIMYFFESTGYRTVFFEDLDRLSDPKIFVHLRELNNLLNNDDAIKAKPIVFVYAVRDDIFSKEDRTKFFDFIIPVIPVINSTNSGEILLQRLQEAKENEINHDISQGFVLDVAPYISDMRILQNIYNEFVVYKKTLRTSQDLSLSDEQMLAMIVFKNLYPSDFADIQDEKGILKKAFEDKYDFIARKKQAIQKRIDNYSDTITSTRNDVMKSIRELKYAMIVTLMGNFHRFDGFGNNWNSSVSASRVMSDDFDMTELIQNGYKHICVYVYNRGNQMISIDADVLSSYVERWKAIKELEETGLQKLQENLQELRDKQHALSGMIFTRLFELYSTDKVLSDEVRNNKLLTFLLRRGYIDEKYANYINYFKGTSITKDDMNFILSVKNQSPLAFDYQLTKISMVIERLQDYEFEQKAIYNFDLLEELLVKGPATKLTAFVVQLADETETSWKFIDEFVSRTEHQDFFIRLLAERWTGMWAHISANETLTYERKLLYLCVILNVADIANIKDQNIDGCLAHFFERHDDILQKLVSCNTSKIISAINCLDVCFETIQITGVPHEVLDCIFDGCHYKLNDSMIRTVVTYKNASMVNMLNEQPYTTIIDLKYAPMTQHIHNNFAAYIREIVLAHATLSDRAEDVVDMLIRLKNEEDLQIQLIIQESFLLDSIEKCAGDQIQAESDTWRPVWNALLAENSIIISWENIIAYWKVYKLSDELKRYISSHADELSAMDTTVVDDEFIRMFIMANFASEVEKKLIPVLRMHTFNLDIPSIDESTLRILIDCKYFEFTVNHYSAIASVSPDIGIEFILKNQDEYMDLRNSISMPIDLFERLMFSDGFRQEHKTQLFSEYAENCMTEKIALQMNTLHLPITKDILYAAWNCVDQGKHDQLLLENCTILNADELEQRFEEIGGIYAELADRTRRHEATLSAIPQHKLLAEHLQAVGYITSWEEKNEKFYDPVLEKEMSRKFLKLRIKQVK